MKPDTTCFLAGSIASFSELYPDVVFLRVTIESLSLGEDPVLGGRPGPWVVSLDDFPGEVYGCCHNRKCHAGGFPLMKFLRPLLSKRATTGQQSLKCCGHEQKGRSKPKCVIRFQATAEIEYKTEEG